MRRKQNVAGRARAWAGGRGCRFVSGRFGASVNDSDGIVQGHTPLVNNARGADREAGRGGETHGSGDGGPGKWVLAPKQLQHRAPVHLPDDLHVPDRLGTKHHFILSGPRALPPLRPRCSHRGRSQRTRSNLLGYLFPTLTTLSSLCFPFSIWTTLTSLRPSPFGVNEKVPSTPL